MLVGLPRMHKEPGELRDFLPGFVSYLTERGVSSVVIEEGYGSGMEFAESDPRTQQPSEVKNRSP